MGKGTWEQTVRTYYDYAQAFAKRWDVELEAFGSFKDYTAAIRDSNKVIARAVSIPSGMLPKEPTFGQAYAAACAELKIHPTKG